MSKYIVLFLFLMFLTLLGSSCHFYKKVGLQKEKIESLEAEKKSINDLLEKERKQQTELNSRLTDYQKAQEQNKNEIEKLTSDIANRTIIPRVRVKTDCPKVSDPSNGSTRTDEANAELGEDAKRIIVRLVTEIKQTRVQFEALQREVLARSDPSFCSPL